jgi:4-diphosphocytidyl-2-C-methyl-D-erythritol kinase
VCCDHPDVPEDQTNLAARAAIVFFDAINGEKARTDQKVTIRIEKKIPVGAGLGGGSSDAAAVLTALNNTFGCPLSEANLMAIGAGLGADVPFFIRGVPAIASGIGDQLTHYDKLSKWTVLLVYPNVNVSTAWVYKNLNLRLTKGEKKLSKFHFDGRVFDPIRDLVNDLEPVTVGQNPVIGEIKRQLLSSGAIGALMSGSGSTVFGLFKNAQQAEKACSALFTCQEGSNWSFFITELLI